MEKRPCPWVEYTVIGGKSGRYGIEWDLIYTYLYATINRLLTKDEFERVSVNRVTKYRDVYDFL